MKKNRLVSRLIQMCVVLIGISFLTFLLTYLAPAIRPQPCMIPWELPRVRKCWSRPRQSMGLDKPFLQQYVDWIGGIFHGDFGNLLQ